MAWLVAGGSIVDCDCQARNYEQREYTNQSDERESSNDKVNQASSMFGCGRTRGMSRMRDQRGCWTSNQMSGKLVAISGWLQLVELIVAAG